MFNSQQPSLDDLPTSKQLLRSTIIALLVALLLLVTVVMPSEYAKDPTGIGRLLGLQQMGEIKQQLELDNAAEYQASVPQAIVPAQIPETAAASSSTDAAPDETATETATLPEVQQHEMSFSLAPNQGAEIKVEMLEGTQIQYHWSAGGGKVNYDTHGDPYGAARNFYHGYGKGLATPEDGGELVAAFDGYHGWFWRNRTNETVTVTLKVKGGYLSIKRVI